MGQVVATLTVRSTLPDTPIEVLLATSTQFPDDGETEPVEFARGALVGLLEVL
jgi:hypothetical protein